MNPDQVGAISEAKVLHKLLEQGYTVSIPWVKCAYDLLVDKDGKISKVQVKTGRYKVEEGVVSFRTCQADRQGRRYDYRGKIDFFIVYCPELDKFYKIPPEEVGGTEARFRIDTPVKSDSQIRWAKDFEF